MQIIYIAAVAWLIYALQRRIYADFWDRELDIDMSFDKSHVVEDETVVLNEVIENGKWLPLPMLYLKYKLHRSIRVKGEQNMSGDDTTTRNELWNVLMKQRIIRRTEITCTQRGIYPIGNVNVCAKGLFMDADYMKALTFDEYLTVYPRLVDISQFQLMLHTLWGENVVADSLLDDPFQIRGVREYQTYDSPKNINWMATARTMGMKVNLFEHTANCKGYVYLNLKKESLSVSNEILEESIRLAKTFCTFFSSRGIPSALFTNGTDGKSVDFIGVKKCGMGTQYLNKIDEALLHICLEETKGTYLYEKTWDQQDILNIYAEDIQKNARNGLVVFISANQDLHIQKYMINLKNQGGAFLWTVPVSHRTDYKPVASLKGRTYVWYMNYEVKKS